MRLYNTILINFILDIIVKHFEDNLINIYKYTFEKDMISTIKNYFDIDEVDESCRIVGDIKFIGNMIIFI